MVVATGVPHARISIYLITAFAVTWICWWLLALQVPPGNSPFATWVSGTLFILGGLGPTIAAYVAVATTPAEGTLSEYNTRLFRWRVNPFWYLAVIALPPALAFGKEWLAIEVGPAGVAPDAVGSFTIALLAWVYAGTRSILLCILFHAANNTAGSIGLNVPQGIGDAAWIAITAKILIAFALLAMFATVRAPRESPASKPKRD